MSELVIRINLDLGARRPALNRCLLAVAMLLTSVPELASESVTLTTYYPAPSGVYTQMITTGNSYLARDASSNSSQVTIGGTANGTGQELDIYSYKGSANNAAIRATYAPGSLGAMEFAAVAHRSNVWVGLYANQGAGSYAAYFNGSGAGSNSAVLINGGGITGNYGLTPGYQNWGAWGTGAGGAAIYNDAGTYKALMLVGNGSYNGARQVSVWDQLNVNGNTAVTGVLGVGLSVVGSGGQSVTPSARIDANGTIIVRELGCFPASTAYPNGSPGGTTVLCAGTNYVTMTSGVMNKRTELATSTDPNVSVLCCPCIGACPGL